MVEEKPEAPGEVPDLGTVGLSGARPLGLGVAVLPPLPPDTVPSSGQFLPSQVAAAKKRPPSLPTPPPPPPPPPPRLDQEVSVHFYIVFYLHFCVTNYEFLYIL